MLGGKDAFRVNLPACTIYGNSELLVWRRAAAFRNIVCGAHGYGNSHVLLPIGGHALWIKLHSGSDIGQCWLLLHGGKHLVWLNVPSTGLSASRGWCDCNNYTKCRVCRPTLWKHS